MPDYKCPECDKILRTAQPVPPGKKLVCPECNTRFVPPQAARAAKPAAAKPAAAKPAKPAAAATIPLAPPTAPPPTPSKATFDEDDTPYQLYQESEEEKRLEELNKPKFSDVKDKFKKSKRGPAMALLVLPANLMIAQGAIVFIVGLGMLVVGGWPLIFTDAVPSDEELVDALFLIFAGGLAMTWSGITIYAAAAMQNLGSYSWAVAGSVMAILPLLAGIYALVTLYDPRVIAGFKEPESGPLGEDGEDDDEDSDNDDEDDDDYDDDD